MAVGEGMKWLRKVVGEMEEHALRSLSAAAGLGACRWQRKVAFWRQSSGIVGEVSGS